jgi:hypothetical protein
MKQYSLVGIYFVALKRELVTSAMYNKGITVYFSKYATLGNLLSLGFHFVEGWPVSGDAGIEP